MKTLSNYIEEKLVINKNYNADNNVDKEVTNMFDTLLNDPESNDITYDKSCINGGGVVSDMLYTSFQEVYSKKVINEMYNKIVTTVDIPSAIFNDKYDTAIEKVNITYESKYNDMIYDILQLLSNNTSFDTKTIKIHKNDIICQYAKNEQYMCMIIADSSWNKTDTNWNEIYSMFLIRYK